MPSTRMRTPAQWWRHGLLSGIALGLTLMCASVVVSSVVVTSTAPMGSMSTMSSAVATADADTAPRPVLSGLCDAGCASEATTMVCSVIAIAAPVTMLILLLTRRRTPFLGVLTRAIVPSMPWSVRGRWRGHVPLSPATLCVWRL